MACVRTYLVAIVLLFGFNIKVKTYNILMVYIYKFRSFKKKRYSKNIYYELHTHSGRASKKLSLHFFYNEIKFTLMMSFM